MQAERALEARLNELAMTASYQSKTCFTRFLDPAQLSLAETIAAGYDVEIRSFGGYANAERAICAFSHQEPEESEFPIVCLKACWAEKFSSPAHRDFLGAIMSLGQDRSCFGDIVRGVGHGTAYLFVHADSAGYVEANLDRAGNASLSIQEIPPSDALIAPPDGRVIRVTVNSMRLDALISAAFRMSREAAREAVLRELVRLNHTEAAKPDAQLCRDDLVSVRGSGRFRVIEEPRETRKGRQGVQLFLYSRGGW